MKVYFDKISEIVRYALETATFIWLLLNSLPFLKLGYT